MGQHQPMWIVYIGILVAAVTATIGLLTNVGLVQTTILVGVEAILAVSLETLQTARLKNDTILGADASRLSPVDVVYMRGLASGLIKARRVHNEFMQERVDDAVASLRRMLSEIASGKAEYDLAPGGIYSEVDVVGAAKTRARVTSFVNPTEYWRSAHGVGYLTENRLATARGIEITRIFIEDRSRLEELRPIVEQQRAAGIECRVAIRSELPAMCLRDFAILDDGHLAVSLSLNDNRMPAATQFMAGATEVGQSEIKRLDDIYHLLIQRSVTAEEFLDGRADAS